MESSREIASMDAAQLRKLGRTYRAYQSAKLNVHDPYHYFKNVLERVSTLPHRWQPRSA